MRVPISSASCYFNPRSYKRSDLDTAREFINTILISIHAPTRGATDCSVWSANNSTISIHAPTRGATASVVSIGATIAISIHAPTRGATNSEHIFDFVSDNFNPRSYKRSDSKFCRILRNHHISIHAPTRGATHCDHALLIFTVISIHAPTRGATL